MRSSLLACCLTFAAAPVLADAPQPALGNFGIELKNRDISVEPGDDFDRYANGAWFDGYELKDYETRHGAFTLLADQAELQVKAIIEEMAKADARKGSSEQKVRDLYQSYMNLQARDAAGIEPLRHLLERIEEIDSAQELAQAFGRSGVDGTLSPLGAGVGPDRKNPDRYLLGIGVGGLGLPDKSFYLDAGERFATIREQYLSHIGRMLGFAGIHDDGPRAKAILALETRIAREHWDREKLRDRDLTYNLVAGAELAERFPGYDWDAHFRAAGLAELPVDLNLSTPDAIAPVIAIIAGTPLAVWRDYLVFHAVDGNAGLLSQAIDDASFAFNGTVLSGQQAQKEPWKRAVAWISSAQGLGDIVGEVYVARHFKPEAKRAMDQLVENLRLALRANIEQLDWMGEETKAEAYRKLASFRPKIGYPDKWRDYSALRIVPHELLRNARALRAYYRADEFARLARPTDKDEWFMTPTRVNAYYNPSFNEIVFPAAILQPPFFDVHADPAVNYGAIGAVIGHEMGHGFDDQGSKSDSQGIQRNWWSAEDRARFEARTRALGAQYEQYCPIEGHCVNAQLSMGENIGDLGGLSMAWTAYRLSLGDDEAPVIDGLTGDQRFFLGWAQVWKSKYREETLVNLLKTDSHSPPRYRINGPLRNMDAWYQAFGVEEGDALYLKPEERVRIW